MSTLSKNLRTGTTLWMTDPAQHIPYSKLTSNLKTQIAIIGAGISGGMLAEELSSAGFECIVLEKRKAPFLGSTMATTALLQYEIDQPLSKLSKLIGFADAARAWRRSKLSIENLATKIAHLNIDCDLTCKESLYLAGNVLDIKHLKEEMALRNQISLPTEYLTRSMLQDKYQLTAKGALRSFNNFSADPYKLAAGFMQKALERGTRLYASVETTQITHEQESCVVHTDSGYTVTADHVIYATGYEVPRQLQNQNFKIYSTWAFATKALKKHASMNMPLIWEASDPYLYLRHTPDGHIICGGEDEEFSNPAQRDAMIDQKMISLQKKLSRFYPHITTTPQFTWAGSFAVTPTGLPLIGKIPRMKNCYAVMAFGGNGITFSKMGAEIIHTLIAGRKDPDADLFRIK
jgi:glycine/D-amino acid oxidase-like deaminating enzyme